MDIKTLESFKLSDAVKFHDHLNPKLWRNQHLQPEVKKQLMIIAQDFVEELGVNNLDVKDITVSGSNAAYSYTPHSDLDLHILVDMSKLPNDSIYRELFDAKKTIYNDSHDITVHTVPVELYVQDSNQPVRSLGEYSLLKDKWLRIPTKRRANFDQNASKSKYEKLKKLIDMTLKTEDLNKTLNVLKTIRRYRQSGLDKGGEFSPENLAYKALRSQGYITKLYDLRDKLHSKKLSIEGMYTSESKEQYKTNLLAKKFAKELAMYGKDTTDEDYDPNGPPPGPEFKPTMPAGTVKVDVSDVYDWYKLGQHISNLKGLGKHDFGSGPPSTIMAFGSEPEEHEYIDALKKTGLTTTDIDPFDPNQPKSMPRQKVDPTYNVNESFDKPYPFTWEKSDFGDYDALATLDDGTLLSIMIEPEGDDEWHVRFDRNFSMGVTGEGDAQRVFATVISAIHQFIQKEHPWRLIFSASKDPNDAKNSESRAKLYNSLIKRYARAWGYDEYSEDHGDQVTYELTRLKKDVAEASGYIPSEKEKNDPRFKTALTVDVHPDSIKKNAKAFNSKISRAGIPPTLKPSGKI